jgi:hypothetical protein
MCCGFGHTQARAAEDFGDDAGEEGAGDGDVEALAEREAAAEGKGPAEDALPWAGSDRDYTYEEMLGGCCRCFHSGFVRRMEQVGGSFA